MTNDLLDLTERDVRLCMAMSLWIEAARGESEAPMLLRDLVRYAAHRDYCAFAKACAGITYDDPVPDVACDCGYTDLLDRIFVEESLAYRPDWVPSGADIMKSRLFWRIRSGKDPLPYAPPRAYSCPWYEVIEEDRPHACHEPIRAHLEAGSDLKYSVCQCLYDAHSDWQAGGKLLLGYGPYRFWAWNDPVTHRGWIQRCPDQEDLEIEVPQIETTDLDAGARSYMSGGKAVPGVREAGAILGGKLSGPNRAPKARE